VITIASKHRRLGLWGVLALAGALAGACEDKKHDHDFTYEKPPEYDRELNQTEIDSMRSMKITHRVTRDDYWVMKGGVIGNDRVEVWYSSRKIYVLQAMAVVKQMDQAADQIKKTLGRLPSGRLVVVCAPNLQTFRRETERDWWHYALIEGDTAKLQTPMTLFMRGLLHTAVQREYTIWALGKLTNQKAPEWLVSGLASQVANERDILFELRKEFAKVPLHMQVKDIEKHLEKQEERIETRRAMVNSYLMVNQLIETHGLPAVAAFTLAFAEEPDANAAAQRAFSMTYDEVLSQAQSWKEPETI
jgi:hypothetical protein